MRDISKAKHNHEVKRKKERKLMRKFEIRRKEKKPSTISGKIKTIINEWKVRKDLIVAKIFKKHETQAVAIKKKKNKLKKSKK